MFEQVEKLALRVSQTNLKAVVAFGGIAVFAVAALLNPYTPTGQPRILGTHEQLGLPSCGFKTITGHPCPGCGMTTCFSLLMHGDLQSAWTTNWAGVVAATGAAFLTAHAFLLLVSPSRCPKVLERQLEAVAIVVFGAAVLRWLIVLLAAAPWTTMPA